MKPVNSIHVSDLHLDDVPPAIREEEDWFAAMARPLDEIRALQEKHQAPIVYAGDIFNRFDVEAKTLNFVMRRLPFGYAVPGQHDLSCHRIMDLNRTSYQSLVEAGNIVHLEPGAPVCVGGMYLFGYPWREELYPLIKRHHSLCLHVAIIHHFVFTKETGYFKAPEDGRLKNIWSKLQGYDAIHCGDNHQTVASGRLFNPGSMMIRTSDQIGVHRPCVGLLHDDASWTVHYLDISKDKYTVQDKKKVSDNSSIDTKALFDGLNKLSDSKVDFQEELKKEAARRKTSDGTMQIVSESMS